MRGEKVRTRIALGFALVFLAGVPPALVRSADGIDPARYLLPAEDLPDGFEQQPQRDREVDEPRLGVTRAFRLYTRGAPEVPTDEHASILLSAAISDSREHAATDFQETVLSWTRMGYVLSPLGDAVGEETMAGSNTLFGTTDHPKQAVLVLFRMGPVNGAVQWTDRPGEVTVEHAVAMAQLMELRIVS